jgi:dipeptidyl aminopeptidase/acylaminoacyl peptidase
VKLHLSARRVGIAATAAFAILGAGASASTIQPDDLFKLASISTPAFSPDGTKIVAVVRRPNRTTDKSDATLVLIDAAGGAMRDLTSGRSGVAAPAYAPDGSAIAFIADDSEKHPQVFVLPLDGGDAEQITKTESGVQQFAWRPDSGAIAYVTADADANKKAVAAHHDMFDVGADDYLTTSHDPPSHLWLVSRSGANAHRLTSGAWSFATSYPPSPPASPLSWSRDGSSILFTRVPNTSDGDAYRSQIERLDVASGKITAVTGHAGFEGFAQYSPDSTKIAYLYSRDGNPNNENDVYLTGNDGGPGVDISKSLDKAIFRAQWFPDGSGLLVGAHEGTHTLLYRLHLDGSYDRIATGATEPSWFFWLDTAVGAHDAIAYPASEATKPSELYAIVSGASPKQITAINSAMAKLDYGRVTTIDWTNEGFKEDGVLVYPPGYAPGKKYPLVLDVHGGPQYASTEDFNSHAQMLAAHGWLVFMPNYRGSDNMGNAYEHAIYNDAGAGPGRDVMAGVAAVEKLGIVDTSRIAVGGWSYGGYMTSWLMAHYHPWKTAISGAAVNNWLDMYNYGDGNVQIAFSFKGSPYVGTNMRDYIAQSPITYAAQTTCPVLVISDTGDVRVPVSQSYQMRDVLRDNHIPVRFVAIPVGGHYPGDPVRRVDIEKLWINWMSDHLR